MHSEEKRGETRAGPRLRPREWGRAVGPSLPRVRSPHGLELPGENKQGMPGRWQNLSQSDVKSRFAVCLLLTWSVSPTFKIDSKSGRMFQRREQDRARGASARGSRAAEGCERTVRQGGARRRGARHLPGDRNGAAHDERSQSSNLRQRSAAAGAPPCCRWGCERGGASGGQRGPGRAFLIARQFRSGYSP